MTKQNSGASKFTNERSAGAVVFIQSSPPEYLLLRSGHWDIPKGLIDAGESDEETAVREVREETGLDIELLPDFREVIQYFYRRKNGALVKKQVVYFLGEARSREFRVSWEHQEGRWVTYEQAMELVEYKNARALLEKANAYLRAGA